jgi:hypothetical protein
LRWEVVIQKGLVHQVEVNLTSQVVVGTDLQKCEERLFQAEGNSRIKDSRKERVWADNS